MVDIIKGIENGKCIEIRNPIAVRPWQHVLEPLGGYLLLGAKMNTESKYDEAWNFGPEKKNIVTVKELLDLTIDEFGKGEWIDLSDKEKRHEANLLSLDIDKAKSQLNWHPLLSLQETVKYTVDWYSEYKTVNVMDLCLDQIEEYMKKWNTNK